MDSLLIKRAILSVTDKTGLVPFASFLAKNNVELVSTGGTAKTLKEAGLKVTLVEEVTGFPEIMGGRVKTLNPHIHGGILADKDNPEHLETLSKHKIKTFDLVCINLYNFAEAASKGLALKDAIEQIDIGGPCMLRAAAKNFSSILVIPEACYYTEIQNALAKDNMHASLELRLKLATKTFELTSNYDAMITKYMSSFA